MHGEAYGCDGVADVELGGAVFFDFPGKGIGAGVAVVRLVGDGDHAVGVDGQRVPEMRLALRWLVQWGVTWVALSGFAIVDLLVGSSTFSSSSGPPPHVRHAVELTAETPVSLIAVTAVLVALAVLPPLIMGIAVSANPQKIALWDRVAGTQVRYRRNKHSSETV